MITSASSSTGFIQHDQVDDDTPQQDNVIAYTDQPTTTDFWLQPLYSDRMMWQVGFQNSELVIRHGYIGGDIQVKKRKVQVNNSGRTLVEQALLEARHRYWKMAHKGYTNGDNLCKQYPKPMLASAYDPKKIKEYPVSVQAKIDGVRSLAWLEGGQVHLRSRENKPQAYLEQIRKELYTLFTHLPPGCHLDGELYVHGWSFNRLISAVRTTKTKHPDNDQVNYYLFDIIINLPTQRRMDLLSEAYSQCCDLKRVCLVPSTPAHSHEEIVHFHNCFVEEGFEGAIVRHLSGCGRGGVDLTAYRPNRSNNLLKVKMFQDEEGIVIDVIEGTGTEEGLAVLVIEDQRGNRFPVRPRGSFELRAQWYQNKQRLVGQRYTFRYFELSEYGVPRFPVGIAFRDYE